MPRARSQRGRDAAGISTRTGPLCVRNRTTRRATLASLQNPSFIYPPVFIPVVSTGRDDFGYIYIILRIASPSFRFFTFPTIGKFSFEFIEQSNKPDCQWYYYSSITTRTSVPRPATRYVPFLVTTDST